MSSNKVWKIGRINQPAKDRAGEALKKSEFILNKGKIGAMYASFPGRVYVLENDHPGKV